MSRKRFNYDLPVTVVLAPDRGYGHPKLAVVWSGETSGHRFFAESFLDEEGAADYIFDGDGGGAERAMLTYRVRVTGKMWWSVNYHGDHDKGFDVEKVELVYWRGLRRNRPRSQRRGQGA